MAALECDEQACNKEIQRGRVHRAAIECHTVLFCCLEVINEIDKDIADIRKMIKEISVDDSETHFNFSSVNNIHFFPSQFHKYFGQAHSSTSSKPKKKYKSKKHNATKVEEEDVNENIGLFLTESNNRNDDDDNDEVRNNDVPRNQKASRKAYDKKKVMDIIAEWLAGKAEDTKSAAAWVDTAIEIVNSSDSVGVLHDGRDSSDGARDIPSMHQMQAPEDELDPDLDAIILCLAEWLEEGLHLQINSDNKTGEQWISAAQNRVKSQYKIKPRKKIKKKPLQPYPCDQCQRFYRGKGKYLPSRLSSSQHSAKFPVKEVHYLPDQKVKKFKFNNGRANDKLFCSWECAKQWNEENTPVLYRYETEQLIRIAAGNYKFK